MKRFLFAFFLLFSSYAETLSSCPTLTLEDLNTSALTLDDEQTSKEYLPQSDKVTGVAMVVHGLNLKPSKMASFSQYLNDLGFYVLQVSLSGHRGNLQEQKDIQWKTWMKQMDQHLCYLKAKSDFYKAPMINLSFSLGALVSMGKINELDKNPFTKQIFLAPATWIHWFGKVPGWLSFMGGKIGLPSKNLEEYRAEDTTSLNCYKAMDEGRKHLEEIRSKNFNIPTLLIIDPDDELVSLKKTKKFLNHYKLNDFWKVFLVSNKDTELEKSYHHLIIDEKSLGKKEWQRLLERLSSFLN